METGIYSLKKRFIGDRNFYKKVVAIALPIMLQNGITNFVGLLDNIMVGRIGTEQMSGVSIVNQLLFILMLCLFGAASGAGVLGAQYYGKGDMEGVRNVFRIKVMISALMVLLAVAVLWLFADPLISLFLHDGSSSGDLQATLGYGRDYLHIMLFGQIPLAVEMCYSSTLRESGETSVPMKASVAALLINLALNYILIYGKLGFPVLGVKGAAVATVVSRTVQALIVIAWSHSHLKKVPYFAGAYRSFLVPGRLVRRVLILAFPLLLNETLWSSAVATQTALYSTRGLAAIAALNINSTIANVFNIVFLALGDSVAIIVGQQLGAGKIEEGKQTAYRIILCSVSVCFVMGTLMFLTAPFFPRVYNTSDEVRNIASSMIRINACMMPFQAFLHSAYFTIRSGGKTFVTFIFDSGFMWTVAIPFAFAVTRFTALPIVSVFLVCQIADILKCVMGFVIMKRGSWARNITR
ncbi:MAG: MATE family efflux transporter [Lachnospiraceae bacterium]|nr:MATE family efflux transporter [Lachnospiraceae bacterium]